VGAGLDAGAREGVVLVVGVLGGTLGARLGTGAVAVGAHATSPNVRTRRLRMVFRVREGIDQTSRGQINHIPADLSAQ
jgi:hypothetical protein